MPSDLHNPRKCVLRDVHLMLAGPRAVRLALLACAHPRVRVGCTVWSETGYVYPCPAKERVYSEAGYP